MSISLCNYWPEPMHTYAHRIFQITHDIFSLNHNPHTLPIFTPNPSHTNFAYFTPSCTLCNLSIVSLDHETHSSTRSRVATG